MQPTWHRAARILRGEIFLKKIITGILLTVLCLTLIGCNKTNGVTIKFGNAADSIDAEVQFSEKELTKTAEEIKKSHNLVLLSEPQKTDYSIVEKFGFNSENYSVIGKKRLYTDNEASMLIDEYGCFTYMAGNDDTYYQFPFSNDECFEMAKQFLVSKELFDDSLNDKDRTIDIEQITEGDLTTVISKSVVFNRSNIEGLKVYGNSNVQVSFNGEGKIKNVIYSIRRYTKQSKATLLNVSDVLNNLILDENCYLEIEDYAELLEIDNMEIAYLAEDTNDDNLFIQPIYYFTGLYKIDGVEKQFGIIAQANKTE